MLIYIATNATPNPASLNFLRGRTVLAGEPLDIRGRDQASQSPLAERLFDISGVNGVFLGSDFIAVSKEGGEWLHLKPAILGAIMEHFMSGAAVLREGRS